MKFMKMKLCLFLNQERNSSSRKSDDRRCRVKTQTHVLTVRSFKMMDFILKAEKILTVYAFTIKGNVENSKYRMARMMGLI